MYAEIAINAPVDKTFDYAVPTELEDRIQPGHLVQVPFGTAMQHGVVLSLHEETSIQQTKPIAGLMDPRPALTEDDIDLAWWMSRTYLTPIGPCLWLLLPPGMTGGRDLRVTLLKDQPVTKDALETEIVALLRRRGVLRGSQLNTALPGKPWRPAVDALAKAGIIYRESILKAPSVRPKTVQTVALAIHPAEIEAGLLALARPSQGAEVLDTVMHFSGALLRTRVNRSAVEKLAEQGLVTVAPDETISLLVSPEAAAAKVDELRRLEKPRRILRLLAREGQPVDVSWVYAQTDATLNDLRRLEEEELVLLGEKSSWRDSLAERDFVTSRPPPLTPEQEAAWKPVEKAIHARRRTPNTSTLGQNSAVEQSSPPAPLHAWRGEEEKTWAPTRATSDIWKQNKLRAREMRQEPTPAENALWQYLRNHQLKGYKFRRQHPIGPFIVDFFCADRGLIIEVDGEIHGRTQDEDAARTEFLENLGLHVLRFKNDDVLGSTNKVLKQIEAYISQQNLAPLSMHGEGLGVRIVATGSASPQKPEVGLHSGPTTFLLHGVTGSGKTEIYLRAIDLTLQQGRTAIFLVPEIALTAQTVRRVAARFAGKIAVVHSGLSPGERYDTWRRARDGLIQVIVGARSALFTPLQDVGLIILDEEHDHSYKQAEGGIGLPQPYYHTRQVAEEMMARNDGVLILGSATPDLETSYRARRGDIVRLHMPSRIMGHRTRIQAQAERAGVIARYGPSPVEQAVMIDLPPVQVVDMRKELKSGNVSIFSRALQTAMTATLQRGEQLILFINRRGQSTYVFCRDCGYVAACPRCDSPLTHHRQGQALRCHRCGYEQAEPTICPNCKSRRIKFFGAGTQQVEQSLHEMFPQARTVRWDADTADTPEAHEAILQRFIDRRADIIVGTQMVAKGLDLPLVTLVGVVSADLGLALPDFRAGERTFQILTQVAGRAGRGLLGGQVVLQTYQPDHYVIAAASKHDYEAFYERELAYRRELGYPPFRRLVRLVFREESEEKAKSEAERAASLLRQRIKTLNLTSTEIIGPAPCFFTKVNRFYRWHLLLRGPDPSVAIHGIDIPKSWHIDVDPMDVL